MWIHDSAHTLLAHPFRQESVGKDDKELKDTKGQFIVQSFVKKAIQSGDNIGDFVEYFWDKPRGDKPIKKFLM